MRSKHVINQKYMHQNLLKKHIFDINSFDFMTEGKGIVFFLWDPPHPMVEQKIINVCQGMEAALCILQLANISCVSDYGLLLHFRGRKGKNIFFLGFFPRGFNLCSINSLHWKLIISFFIHLWFLKVNS